VDILIDEEIVFNVLYGIVLAFALAMLLYSVVDTIADVIQSAGKVDRKRDDKMKVDLKKFNDDDIIKLAFVDKQFGLPNENYFERIIKPQYNGKNAFVHKAHLEVFMFTNSSARKYVLQTMADLLGSTEYFVKDDILYCIGELDSDEEKKIKEVMTWLGGFGTYNDHMVKYRVDNWNKIFEIENYGRNKEEQ
jgi:hypothetical protein